MLQPMDDRLIIKQNESKQESTASGFVLVNNQPESNIATVVAVGEGRILKSGDRAQVDFVVGDKIVYNKLATQDFSFDGQEYMSIYMGDVLAILENNE